MTNTLAQAETVTMVAVSTLKLAACRTREVIGASDLATAPFDPHDPVLYYVDTEGVFRVIHGWRRVLLARAKGVKEIEGKDIGEVSEQRILELVLRTGLTHKRRDPLAMADQVVEYLRMRPDIGSGAKLATFLGVSHTTIDNLRHLAVAPEELRQRLARDEISVEAAYRLAKELDPATRKRVKTPAALATPEHRAASIAVLQPVARDDGAVEFGPDWWPRNKDALQAHLASRPWGDLSGLVVDLHDMADALLAELKKALRRTS